MLYMIVASCRKKFDDLFKWKMKNKSSNEAYDVSPKLKNSS